MHDVNTLTHTDRQIRLPERRGDKKDQRIDGCTDGQTDRWVDKTAREIDGWTDGQTDSWVRLPGRQTEKQTSG